MDKKDFYSELFAMVYHLIGIPRRAIGFPAVFNLFQLMQRTGVHFNYIDMVRQSGYDVAMAEISKSNWIPAFQMLVNLQDLRTRENYARWTSRAKRVLEKKAFDPLHPFDRYAAMCADLRAALGGKSKAVAKQGGGANKSDSFFDYSNAKTMGELIDAFVQFFELQKLWNKYVKKASSKSGRKASAAAAAAESSQVDEMAGGRRRFQKSRGFESSAPAMFGPFKILQDDDPSYDQPKLVLSSDQVISFNKKSFSILEVIQDVAVVLETVATKLQHEETRKSLAQFCDDLADAVAKVPLVEAPAQAPAEQPVAADAKQFEQTEETGAASGGGGNKKLKKPSKAKTARKSTKKTTTRKK